MYLQRWHGWCPMKLLPSRRVLCTPYNHAPCHFMQSHICKVHACLAATCHLHFWRNDLGLLHATAVTQGWNRYRNKSQHRKLTLEKKILPLLLQGFKPATFRSRVWRSNHWAIPAPIYTLTYYSLIYFCYNHNGWLGVKHQITYLLRYLRPQCIQNFCSDYIQKLRVNCCCFVCFHSFFCWHAKCVIFYYTLFSVWINHIIVYYMKCSFVA